MVSGMSTSVCIVFDWKLSVPKCTKIRSRKYFGPLILVKYCLSDGAHNKVLFCKIKAKI